MNACYFFAEEKTTWTKNRLRRTVRIKAEIPFRQLMDSGDIVHAYVYKQKKRRIPVSEHSGKHCILSRELVICRSNDPNRSNG